MFYLNVILTVKDSAEVAVVAGHLRRAGDMSRLEPGCERWEAYQSETEPTKFFLVETWTTREHWEQHRQAVAVTTIYLPEVLSRCERDGHPSRRVG
ncbi:MAG: putative quinol monooxygenase [Planctomycetia bacterium]